MKLDTHVHTIFVAPSIGAGLPYYREMRIYWPRPRVLARELRAHGVVDRAAVSRRGIWFLRRQFADLVVDGMFRTFLMWR